MIIDFVDAFYKQIELLQELVIQQNNSKIGKAKNKKQIKRKENLLT